MEWWRGLCAGKEAVAQAPLIVQRRAEMDDRAWRSKEKEIVRWIDEAAVRDMNLAAQRGDVVHDYAEKVCRSMLGEPFDIPLEREKALAEIHDLHRAARHTPKHDPEGYFTSLHAFLKDFRVEPLRAEGTVWNEEFRYAGTNDLLCRIHGEVVLLDWKTKKAVKDVSSPWYKRSVRDVIALQLEAAQRAEEVFDETTEQWVEWDGRDAQRQIGVAIAPNGYEAVQVNRSDFTWETFKALRVAWEWRFNSLIDTGSYLGTSPLPPPPPPAL